MSARAKPKRRGHVQQYSTGGGNGGDTGPSNPTASGPVAPPLATLPRPGGAFPNNFAANGRGAELHATENTAQYAHGLQNPVSGVSAAASNSSPYNVIPEQPADMLLDEHRDPWDEEIGDIPWEDDAAPETQQSESFQPEVASNPPAQNEHQWGENGIDSLAEPEPEPEAGEEDLAELPWDEEPELEDNRDAHFDQQHDNEFTLDTQENNAEGAGFPWEQSAPQRTQNLPWEEPLEQQGDQEEQTNDHWNADEDNEAQSWGAKDEAEQQNTASKLPWEHNEQHEVREDPQDDFWQQEQPHEDFAGEIPSEHNPHYDFHEQQQQQPEPYVEEGPYSYGNFEPEQQQQQQPEQEQGYEQHDEWVRHEESHEYYDESHGQEAGFTEEPSELPWERKKSDSFRSHRSFLDSDEPQALNIQKSDHPSETAVHAEVSHQSPVEVENWMHDNHTIASEDHHVGADHGAYFEQEREISIPGIGSLLPAANVQPSSQGNETSEWEDQPTELSIQQSEGLSIQYNPKSPNVPIENNEDEVHGAQQQTPWPSVNENSSEATGKIEMQSHVQFDGDANQEAGTGNRLFFENSDVPSIDLKSTENTMNSTLDDKRAKALELLDLDDDLLLDDDFLDDEPEFSPPHAPAEPTPTVEKPAAPKTSFASKYSKPAEAGNPGSQYAPQPAAPRSAFVPPPSHNIIPSKSTQASEAAPAPDTRKNDAYDFPVEFATQKPKPAARAPSTIIHSRNATPAVAQGTALSNAQSSAGTGGSNKPFFEDLPVSLPKPANKSKRAAPAAISVSPKLPQPPALTQEPSATLPIKSPKNPYASLALKVGLSVQQQQVPGIPDRAAGAPSKYQPAGGPAIRPPQQSNTPVPMKAGVLPPPGINLQTANRQISGVPQPGNNIPPVAVNQYAPASFPQQNGQFQNLQNGPVMPPNQYAPAPLPQQPGKIQGASSGPVAPPSQYAPAPLPHQNGQNYQNGALMPPNQFATAPYSQQHGQLQALQNGHILPQIGVSQPVPSAQEIPAPSVNRAPRINTNVAKSNEKNSSLSPYVPNAGPYGPAARTHSRTSSLIGGNAREGNPYAPVNQGGSGQVISPNNASASMSLPGVRKRGKSNARTALPTISQVPEKVENPEALLRRQFPIFTWGPSDHVVSCIPHFGNGFELPQRIVRVAKVSVIAPGVEVFPDFPGPLSRSKSKRKDIEVWLEKNIAKLRCDFSKADELLINELLYALIQNDGEFTSLALHKKWASILTPNVDFSFTQDPNSGFRAGAAPGLSANAFKLDNNGINTVWALVQAGNRAGALDYAISKQDWAFAFIIAQSLGQETFKKVCSDYARISFPFQTNQNTRVQHLMPLLLKIFVGNTKSVIDDFTNVASEAEFAKSHYREIISAAIVNGASTEFLVDFGNFLGKSGLVCASEICFMLAGLILSRVPLQNGAVFSMIGSFTSTSVYSEVYEYVLSMSSTSSASIPPTGLPDLLPAKIKRAQVLADMGHFAVSRKYCDHIGSVIKTLGKSPFVTPNVSADFKTLLVRLSDCSSSESGWLGTKLSKVNLDKVWGQLDKFIGGDDPNTKSGEKGVFSKFSPNISRKSSMLDVTSVGFHRSESFVGPPQLTSAPPTEFSSPSQRQTRHAPQKYAPNQTQVTPQAPSMNTQIHGPGNNSTSGAPVGRYHPQMGSSTSINLLDSHADNKHEVLSGNTHSAPPKQILNSRKQIYANRAAQLSASSIISQNAVSHGAGAGAQSPAKLIASLARPYEIQHQDSAHPARSINGHSRTSSHQSVSFDPSRSPLSKRRESNLSLQKEEEVASGPVEIPVRSQEYQDNVSEGSVSVSSNSEDVHVQAVPEEISNGENGVGAESLKSEAPIQDQPAAPPAPQTEAPAQDLAAPKKVNPYAPNEQRRNNKGTNRYGPGAAASAASTNRYRIEPKTADENLAGMASGTPYSGVLDDKQQTEANAVAENSKVEDNVKANDEPVDKDDSKEVDVTESEDRPSESTSQLQPPHPPITKKVPRTPIASRQRGANQREKRNPYAPVAKPLPANVDTSFDASNQEDADDQDDVPRATLILNGPGSPESGFKPGFVNPYQESKRASADTHISNGFDEFPIPGSPEYTTRANSVIGHTGLYSSRLSQSQQSALYQQYEVKDDTVLDYVPVPEEEEEDEVQSSKSATRKKDMADAKQKIQEEMSRRGGGENAESGWFKGWLGNKKNDDKPKPIRAKLGKANTFKYDEKHKRWIDSSRPLEEQLKEAAPPPPPKKKIQAEKSNGEAPAIAAPAPMRGPSAVPSTIGGRRASVTKTPSKTAPEPAAPRPNLANAGLDDLLNLNSSNKGPASAAGRRGKRRYVNVMETK